jgi:calcineurin-like phosphoesterase family protein
VFILFNDVLKPDDAIYLGKMITTYSKERKKTEIKKMFS